jgi:hypothetical protein
MISCFTFQEARDAPSVATSARRPCSSVAHV